MTNPLIFSNARMTSSRLSKNMLHTVKLKHMYTTAMLIKIPSASKLGQDLIFPMSAFLIENALNVIFVLKLNLKLYKLLQIKVQEQGHQTPKKYLDKNVRPKGEGVT